MKSSGMQKHGFCHRCTFQSHKHFVIFSRCCRIKESTWMLNKWGNNFRWYRARTIPFICVKKTSIVLNCWLKLMWVVAETGKIKYRDPLIERSWWMRKSERGKSISKEKDFSFFRIWCGSWTSKVGGSTEIGICCWFGKGWVEEGAVKSASTIFLMWLRAKWLLDKIFDPPNYECYHT